MENLRHTGRARSTRVQDNPCYRRGVRAFTGCQRARVSSAGHLNSVRRKGCRPGSGSGRSETSPRRGCLSGSNQAPRSPRRPLPLCSSRLTQALLAALPFGHTHLPSSLNPRPLQVGKHCLLQTCSCLCPVLGTVVGGYFEELRKQHGVPSGGRHSRISLTRLTRCVSQARETGRGAASEGPQVHGHTRFCVGPHALYVPLH